MFNFISNLLIMTATSIVVSNPTETTINFNADYILQTQEQTLNVSNRDQILEKILEARPQGLDVYPSEGYFYFDFFAQGEWVRGNLRFDASTRDAGHVSFAYFIQNVDGTSLKEFVYDMNSKQGLVLTKISPFVYELNFKGIKREVRLYDAKRELSSEHPILSDEEYVGPTFDESGVRFHLVFDQSLKSFFYILNNQFGDTESYIRTGTTGRILQGTRTGFIYFDDQENFRKILIGVNRELIEKNSYFDGPFDQLPDNFVDPDHLRQLIEKSDPTVKGKLGDYGHFLNDKHARYAITSYSEYTDAKELESADFCASLSNSTPGVKTCLRAYLSN